MGALEPETTNNLLSCWFMSSCEPRTGNVLAGDFWPWREVSFSPCRGQNTERLRWNWYTYIFLCCNGTNLCLHNNLVLSCSQAPFWLAPTELDQATRTSTKGQQMMKKTTLERKTITSRSADQQAKKALASQKICRITSQRSPSPTTTTSAEDTQRSRTPVPSLPQLPQSLLQVRHAFHVNRISCRFQAY